MPWLTFRSEIDELEPTDFLEGFTFRKAEASARAVHQTAMARSAGAWSMRTCRTPDPYREASRRQAKRRWTASVARCSKSSSPIWWPAEPVTLAPASRDDVILASR